MLTFLRKHLAVIFTGLMLAAVPIAVPAAVYADEVDIGGGLNCGAGFDITETNCPTSTEGPDRIQRIIETVVNVFSVIVAIVAVIMIIWGGFKYITSGGDSGNITTAKNTIIYAIIGLVIVALAQFLVQFVLSTVLENG